MHNTARVSHKQSKYLKLVQSAAFLRRRRGRVKGGSLDASGPGKRGAEVASIKSSFGPPRRRLGVSAAASKTAGVLTLAGKENSSWPILARRFRLADA